jgi:hypothetical protein
LTQLIEKYRKHWIFHEFSKLFTGLESSQVRNEEGVISSPLE